ncbi:unnamed protein product [Macrosiphum euphorbiae]|uniref:Uncharacterized protein n=1 Tax=Macrosiphum euphorbiae TaxID=13131 RepID=A0AAV0X8D2_9HEMI|nr:unnamed protein product [Macrosiphum euphorbiae]
MLLNNVSTFSSDIIKALVKSVDFMSVQLDIFENQIKEIFCSLKQIQSENKLIKDQTLNYPKKFYTLTKQLTHWNGSPLKIILNLLVSSNSLKNCIKAKR